MKWYSRMCRRVGIWRHLTSPLYILVVLYLSILLIPIDLLSITWYPRVYYLTNQNISTGICILSCNSLIPSFFFIHLVLFSLIHTQMHLISRSLLDLSSVPPADLYLVSELVEVSGLTGENTTIYAVICSYRYYPKSVQHPTDANYCLDVQFSHVRRLHIRNYKCHYSFIDFKLYHTLHGHSWSTSRCGYLVSLRKMFAMTSTRKRCNTSIHYIGFLQCILVLYLV